MNNFKKLITLTLLLTLTIPNLLGKTASNNKLWYSEPGNEWMEAIPIGNGRLFSLLKTSTVEYSKSLPFEFKVTKIWV